MKRGRSTTRSTTGKRGRSVSSFSRGSTKSIMAGTLDSKRTWPLSNGYGRLYDPFPNQMRSIMRYSTTINLDAGIATPAYHIFRAAGIYDPDYTGTGHQPYGYDQYDALYSHYVVEKAIITATPVSGGSNTILGICILPDTSPIIDYDGVREAKGVKLLSLAGGYNSGSEAIVQTYNKNEWWRGTSTDTSALYGADPTEGTYFQVFSEGNLSTANPTAVAVMVTITYIVRSFELRNIPVS